MRMTQTPTQATDSSQPVFDYRGLKCPLPVLKARRALSTLRSGQKVQILADDPASPLDMAHFCENEGHQLERSQTCDDHFVYVIIKGQKS